MKNILLLHRLPSRSAVANRPIVRRLPQPLQRVQTPHRFINGETSSAMQAWVDAHSNLFHNIGYSAAIEWKAFCVRQGATEERIDGLILVGSSAVNGLDTRHGVSAEKIEAAFTPESPNEVTSDLLYANLAATLSPALATGLSLLGGDANAMADALAFISDGMAACASSQSSFTTFHLSRPRPAPDSRATPITWKSPRTTGSK